MRGVSALNAELLSKLHAAAGELLPVIVEIEPSLARFSAFIDSIRVDGDQRHPWLVLAPIAANALPIGATTVRIRPAEGGGDWVLTAHHVERGGPAQVKVRLTDAHVQPFENGHVVVAVHPTDLLVLVVPGGLHGSSTYVFPIQRIGADRCEIRSSIALTPGQLLPQVEIVGDRRLLRRASAQVLETVPWFMADGSESFCSRISLAEAVSGDTEHSHDLVTDPREVRRLLSLAAMMRTQGWYDAPGWSRGTLRFLEAQKDRAVLELTGPAHRNTLAHATAAVGGELAPRAIRIGIELFAIAYELDVRLLELDAGRLQTSLPLILRRRRRHRREHRVMVNSSQAVSLSFRHPVSGLVQKHALSEVSFFGLAFVCDPHSFVLWPGLPLEAAVLSWAGRVIVLGDLVVEQYQHDPASGETRCIAAVEQSSVADDPNMIALVATLGHPHVRLHDGEDFVALHDTYLKAGLFGPHMHRNLAPIMEQTRDVWRVLHRDASDVVCTFVHGPEHAPDAAVTVMRAWEHAWVLQHFVDTTPELNGATGKLQFAYLDHLVPRPDGRYLLFFIKTDNHIMNAYLKRFFASTGTPDAVSRCTVELWSRRAEAARGPELSDAIGYRACEPSDRMLVYRAAERCLGSDAAIALSMVPEELDLPDTRARFSRAGLERHRRCQIVVRNGIATYAIIEECSTPGMNLTWMLNAAWIIPLHVEHDTDGAALHAALASVLDRSAQSATGDRFLNLPVGLNRDVLQAWGFVCEAALYLYVVTRAGLHRLYHYTAARCGEVEAMALRRERKRELGRGSQEEP